MANNKLAKVVLLVVVALLGAIMQQQTYVSSQEQAQLEQQVPQFLAAPSGGAAGRLFRRQISPSDQLYGGGPQAGPDEGGFLSGLNNLAQQAQAVTQVQQLIQQAQSLFRPRSALAGGNPAEAAAKSALDTAQSTSVSALQTGQTAQTGGLSTLSELAAGLQRIAQNNPNLIPELKNLYDRIAHQVRAGRNQNQLSQQLAAANNNNANYPANIVPANDQYQLADNLAKAAVPGLQIGQQPPPQAGFYPNLFSGLQNTLQGARLA